MEPPAEGVAVPEAGAAPADYPKKVFYKRKDDVELELTLKLGDVNKKTQNRSIYYYGKQSDIPIFANCTCCNEVLHASAFGVKDGSIEVRKMLLPRSLAWRRSFLN